MYGRGPRAELEDKLIMAPLRLSNICGKTIQHIMVSEPMLTLTCCHITSWLNSGSSIGISYITPTLFTIEQIKCSEKKGTVDSLKNV